MNPDQTPTPETDAAQKWTFGDNRPGCSFDRAEAKESRDVVTSLLQNSDSLRAEVERLTYERNEWQCSAMLYHSELRDLAEGKKVETNLGYAVEKLIRGLRAEVDRLTKERDDAPSPAETVQKDWDAMNGFTDEAKALAMFNLALSLEGDLNAMIRDADAYKEQLSKCEAHAGAMAKEYDAQVDSLRALVIAKREEN